MTDEPDETDIATAFEDLQREVGLTRAAVESLTDARDKIPDYGPTLREIADALKSTAGAAARIEKSPAVSLSPAAMTVEIVKAGAQARAADVQTIREAGAALARSCGQIDLMIKRGQSADGHHRRRIWETSGALLAGMVIWSFLPGTIARSLPSDWAMPERLAAHMIGTDRWSAGQKMMESEKPELWRQIAATVREEDDARSATAHGR
jgi:hypothetical protein